MTTLAACTSDIQDYTTNTETTFVAEIPRFIKASEERIFFFVQLPFFRKNVTGAFTASNPYLETPTDFLAPASFAAIVPDALLVNQHIYLINKDVSYIREIYPNPLTTGVPAVYALFDDDTFIVAPTPASAYAVELHYFYCPASLVDTPAGTWLSLNAYDTLLYGALSESANFMKKNGGIDGMAEEYEKRFLIGLQGLKTLGETRDRKDVYRSGEKRGVEG